MAEDRCRLTLATELSSLNIIKVSLVVPTLEPVRIRECSTRPSPRGTRRVPETDCARVISHEKDRD